MNPAPFRDPFLPAGRYRIVLDTDLGSDCDDAGALAVLHALADAGEAEIAACGYSSGINPYGPGGIVAINTYYGQPEVPVGAAPESALGDPRNDFLEAIATGPHGGANRRREEAPGLVAVCRRALAAAPDGSVRIVSIGHLGGLDALLASPPDAASGLPGRELIARKVDAWIAMGGEFPREQKPGWNFGKNGAARHSRRVLEQWPTPVVFTGYEIGLPLLTGPGLRATPADNPVRESYRLWNNALETGRASWDQTAVLCAVRGPGAFWSLNRGRCTIDEAGLTSWRDDAKGPHAYLVAQGDPALAAAEIEALMCRPPRLRSR